MHDTLNPFQAGDTVVATEGCHYRLTPGKHYEVSTVSGPFTRVADDGGREDGFLPHNFTLAPVTYTRKEIAAALSDAYQSDGGFPPIDAALGDLAKRFGLYPHNHVELIDMDTGKVLA